MKDKPTLPPLPKLRTARLVKFIINGEPRTFEIGQLSHQVEPSHTLLYTLRETLGLMGTKLTCDTARAAVVPYSWTAAALSCMLLTVECGGSTITTIEGLQDHDTDLLDPLQQSFIDHTAFQCGFFTPGIIMSAKALLN